jgi:hypothetical protein
VGHDDLGATPTFREFTNWVLDIGDSRQCNVHWRPQTALLYPDLINYGFVLKLENLHEDLQRLFDSASSTRGFDVKTLLSANTYNTSLPVNWLGLYDPPLAARVAKFYVKDFITYGYDKDSWIALAAQVSPDFDQLETAALLAIRARNLVIRGMWEETVKMVHLAPSRRARPFHLIRTKLRKLIDLIHPFLLRKTSRTGGKQLPRHDAR